MADTQKQRIYPEQRISFAYLPISGPVAARLSATLPAASNAAEQTGHHRLEQALVSQLCARLTGTDFLPRVVNRTALGQPYLTEPFLNVSGRTPGISFSHSRGWLAGVVSEAPQIGIDIERPRPGRDVRGIADLAFGPRERRYCDQQGEPGFYRIWTLREAIAKARGLGLSDAADARDRVHDGPEQGEWRVEIDGEKWYLQHRVIDAAGEVLYLSIAQPGTEDQSILCQEVVLP